MQEFLENVSLYPRYLISLILGIFLTFFGRFKGFLSNPITAIALVGTLAGAFAFLFFTLKAMLGLSSI